MNKPRFFIWLPVLSWCFATTTLASEDQETARHLSEAGEILPLEKILESAQQHQPGRIIEVELEKSGGKYIYEIELLNTDGIVWELELDARTGQLLDVEQED